jgi:hypothetical protein
MEQRDTTSHNVCSKEQSISSSNSCQSRMKNYHNASTKSDCFFLACRPRKLRLELRKEKRRHERQRRKSNAEYRLLLQKKVVKIRDEAAKVLLTAQAHTDSQKQ